MATSPIEKETSFHTRYRPQDWDEVLGNQKVVAALKKAIERRKQKAFVLIGPSGVGKTTLARICAKEVAGKDFTETNIQEVDAATNTGVQEMRSIASRSFYRAVGASGIKTIIIDEAHRISGAAWDSLLKILEEPPAHVYWIFCTTNFGKIPKTVKTRCAIFNLKEVPEEDIYKLLKKVAKEEELEVDKEILETIAENAGGSPRQGLVFLEQCMYAESSAEARQIMGAAGADSKEVVDLCRFILKPAKNWETVTKLVKAIVIEGGAEAESVRIVVTNYVASALMGTKGVKEAERLLGILEAFEEPYPQSDKVAPLLLSIGRAIGLGE